MNKYIIFNNNSQEETRMAEKQKANLENKGYTLKNTFVNSITGKTSLHYQK